MPLPLRGQLPGVAHLDSKIAPKVKGDARPLAPGEFIANPDGSWSSEVSATVADPGLNGGKATNVPTLWIIGGKPVRVDEDTAAMLAASSGLNWPAYNSLEEADKAAGLREQQWQKLSPQTAGQVPPLWLPDQ